MSTLFYFKKRAGNFIMGPQVHKHASRAQVNGHKKKMGTSSVVRINSNEDRPMELLEEDEGLPIHKVCFFASNTVVQLKHHPLFINQSYSFPSWTYSHALPQRDDDVGRLQIDGRRASI